MNARTVRFESLSWFDMVQLEMHASGENCGLEKEPSPTSSYQPV